MEGHWLLCSYHIEKIINCKKLFSNGDAICPTVLKNKGSFFSGALVDNAVVFWEDKKLEKLFVISQIEQFVCQCKEPQPQKLLVLSTLMQSHY